VSGNSGGGIRILPGSGNVTLNNSIVANSSSGADISGSYTGSHNLTGTVVLGPLHYNGGPTQTMAPPPASPALDAGDNSLVPAGVTTDQRGFPRISNSAVDIGAFEAQWPTITGLNLPAAPSEGSPTTLRATATFEPPGATFTWTVTPPPARGSVLTLNGASASFTPLDNGGFKVSLTVSDTYGSVTLPAALSVPVVPPTGLEGWWRGEGGPNDSIGLDNGIPVGNVTYAAGRVGQAFNFDGSSDVQVPEAPFLDLAAAVSLEAWVNPSTLSFTGGLGAVLVKGSGASRNYGLYVRSDGGVQLSFITTGGASVVLNSAPGLVPVGQFTHVAGVINTAAGGGMQIYVNGQPVATGATGGPLVTSALPLTIGKTDTNGFQGLIDEAAVWGQALHESDVQSHFDIGTPGVPYIPVLAVPPTPTLAGFTTGLATQVLTYTASATSPSPLDQEAGFTYKINWADGSPVQTVAATAGNGSGVNITHVYTTAGTYTPVLTAFDRDGFQSTGVFRTVTVLPVTSPNLQTVINLETVNFQGPQLTFQEATDAQAQTLVTAVNGLAAQTVDVFIYMNLGSANYTDLTPNPKAGIFLIITGSGGTTTIVGNSPALDVAGGNVIVENLTLITDTESPTVAVSDGDLTLRNVVIQGTSSGTQPAVDITGGDVDLGTAADPGGNTVSAYGQGELIHNAGNNGVSAVGDTFKVGGKPLTSPYRIKDKIFDALNAGGGGLVTYVPGNVYITVSGGDIQRGVDAIAAGGTVNVEAGGSYEEYDAGSKLVTVAFQNGPALTQEADSLNPSLRTLVVRGTPGDDTILFNPGGGPTGTVKVLVNHLPQGAFSPTGRLIAYGVAGDDDIAVAGGVTLPAWLYGGTGNNRLKGGGGNNVVVGGAGHNVLFGGRGRDLLIGGSGSSTFIAGSGDDLLVAGTTAYDANEAALAAIMAEWTSGRDYATRIANLSGSGSGPRNNGSYFLIASGPNATVFDNGAIDVLKGGSGMDWFFADLAQDIIQGRHHSEIVENL
jgi:hypothetical protein